MHAPHLPATILSSLLCLAVEAAADDESGYDLFHPTPAGLMRELSADRPDKTDSPFTVDAGHFQLEMDFASFTANHGRPREEDWEFAPVNFKAGLTNDLDFQFAITPARVEHNGGRLAGFGDMVPRLKWNLAGNDGGPFALALMPFVKLPSSTGRLGNGSVEGGLKVPYAFEVPGWELGLQTEADWVRNEGRGGCHEEYVNSISIGHVLVGRVSVFVEFFSSISSEGGAGWVGTVDAWLTYEVSSNLRLDAGVYLGVTRAADDVHPFIGMTWRY